MIPFLLWLPTIVSLILGSIYLFMGEGKPLFKLLCVAVFLVAAYLQFVSRHSLSGLLVQSALALGLVLWHRTTTAS